MNIKVLFLNLNSDDVLYRYNNKQSLIGDLKSQQSILTNGLLLRTKLQFTYITLEIIFCYKTRHNYTIYSFY